VKVLHAIKRRVHQYLLRHFPYGGAARSVVTLASGTTIGQLAVVSASPILSRLYTPEEFGVLGVYAALIGMIGVVAGLRYELAIPLPRSIGSATNLLALTLIIVGITTFIVLVIVLLFQDDIPLWLNTPAITKHLIFIPIGIFLSGFYQAFNYWSIRKKYFTSIAHTSALQGISGAGAQIGFGLFQTGSIGLMAGQMIGQFTGITALIRRTYRNDRVHIKRLSWLRVRLMAKRYRRFPKYTTWQALLNTCSTMLPLILFATLVSPTIAGLYMLSHRALSLPLSLVGRSIGQVFHSKAAEAYLLGNLDQLTLSAFRRLLKIGLGPMIFIAVLAPDIFGFAFGVEWRQAGIYAQWMMPWLIIQFVVSPLSITSNVTGHQLGELVSQLLFVIVRVGALLIGTYATNDNISVELYAISGMIVYIGFLVWIFNLLDIKATSVIKAIYPALPIAVACMSLSIIIKLIFT
jgi:O-antigen/teichoic acid export membrane protein